MGTSYRFALCTGALRRFAGCGRGNIAIITAFVLVPLVAMVGGSVDLMRMTAVQNKMRAALEAGALAGAALVQQDKNIKTEELETAVDDYVTVNLPDDGFWSDISITTTRETDSPEVVVSGSIEVTNFFLGIVNESVSEIKAVAAASASGTGELELALVLDISSSMDGSKIDALRPAAKNLINKIFDRFGSASTSVNLIPFGGSVNIGSALFEKYAVANIDADAVDPGPDIYKPDADGNAINNQKFKFTDKTGGLGGNCIEIADKQFLDGKLPENDAGALPYFYMYNAYCPSDETAAIFNTNDQQALLGRIDGMELADGTGMEIAMFWALRSMSPYMKNELGGDFNERPLGWGTGTKVVIMMGDGIITEQHRPVDYTDTDIDWTEHYDDIQIVYGLDTAKDHYLSMCSTLKGHGVTIFTIGYEVGSDEKALLQSCASSSNHYSDATENSIDSVFQKIAESIGGTALRITQ